MTWVAAQAGGRKAAAGIVAAEEPLAKARQAVGQQEAAQVDRQGVSRAEVGGEAEATAEAQPATEATSDGGLHTQAPQAQRSSACGMPQAAPVPPHSRTGCRTTLWSRSPGQATRPCAAHTAASRHPHSACPPHRPPRSRSQSAGHCSSRCDRTPPHHSPPTAAPK